MLWRGLLATTSLVSLVTGAALFGPLGSEPADAASCAVNVVANSGAVTNSAAINCININGVTVTGNVTNTSGGTITAGNNGGTRTGILINTNGTVTGTVVNNGSIAAPSGIGIGVFGNAVILGGISNSGTLVAKDSGIDISTTATFGGGITNSGTISSTNEIGIDLFSISTFTGGISNSGTLVAKDSGIDVSTVSIFTGGINNSGIISSTNDTGIDLFSISTFSGGISNSGTIASAKFADINISSVATFQGGVTNSGTLSAAGSGIVISNVSTFAGGVSNSGRVTANLSGIHLAGISNFSGGIANSGTMTAGGSGIRINSVSTFTGGVTNGGVISAGNGGINLSGNGALFSGGITNSGKITAHSSGISVAVSTFLGGITNTGTISSAQFAGININGAVTLQGGINNSGKIAGGDSGILVSNTTLFQGGVTNSGTISATQFGAMNINDITTFQGAINNSGTISGGSAGIELGFITVFGTNSAGGGILNSGAILAQGTALQLDHVATFLGGITNTGTISGNVGIAVVSSGAVSIFDSGIITGAGGTAVNLTNGSAGNTFTLGPGYQINGKVLGFGSDTFQLGGTGNGAFDLSTIGATQQYEGFTTFNVVGGTWTVSNAFGQSQAWNVDGGTLAGTGTLKSVNVNSGGTLEPGTPGTAGTFMTINGNLAFQSGAIYLVQINGTTASRANVSGTVSLAGAVQGFLAPGSYSAKTTYDILDPTSITGKFTGFTSINDPGFTGTLTYTPTEVLLSLNASLGASGGLNVNQQNVANSLNAFFNNGGTLPAAFAPIFGLSGGNLANALTQLDGEAATGAEKGAFQLMTEFLGLMLDPFVYGRGGGLGGAPATGFAPNERASLPPDIALAYDAVLKAPPAAFDQRWAVWGASYGGSSTTNGDPAVGSTNVTAQTFGFAGGMDYHFTPDTVAGFALAGGGTNWGLEQGLGGGRSDAFQAGVYGITRAGPAYLAAALAFTNNWFTTNRIALGDQLTASFDGQSFGARVEAGYRYAALPMLGVTPYAAFQAQDFHTPSYSETDLTGGGFGLSYNAMTATDLRSELGARFDDLQVVNGMPVILRARVAWAHDWVSNPALDAVFQSLPGASFVVNGAPPPQNSALASVGAQLYLTPSLSLIAKFDGEFANGAQTYAGSGTLRYTW